MSHQTKAVTPRAEGRPSPCLPHGKNIPLHPLWKHAHGNHRHSGTWILWVTPLLSMIDMPLTHRKYDKKWLFELGNSSRPPPYSSECHRQGDICSCHTVSWNCCNIKLELWTCKKVVGSWKHEDNLTLPYIYTLPKTPGKHWNEACLFVSQLQSWVVSCQIAKLLGNLFWEIFKSFLKKHSTSQLERV